MDILIVTQYFWPENFRINDLALGLFEKGHKVTVLTGIPNYPEGHFFLGYGFFKNIQQNYNGIRVIRVPLLPRGHGGAFHLALNYISFAFCASLLGPFYCREKFDLIFVFEPSPITVGLPALVLKKLKSVPIIFWVQDLWPESLSATGAVQSEKILKMVERLVRFIYRRCERILVTSRAYSAPIERHGVDPCHILYFPQSVEDVYKPMTAESDAIERVMMPTGFRIMFAGNIGAAQDFGTILDAAERLKDYSEIHWVIIGDGRMRSWVEQQVKERGLSRNFHLLGRYPIQSMPHFFALADVMLVTLKREPIFALTLPGKIQSYLACGKPIIAALDGEGALLVRESGAGLSCPAQDADALAKAVLAMHRIPDEDRKIMGIRGREYYAVNFDRNILISKLTGWMQELVNEVEDFKQRSLHA